MSGTLHLVRHGEARHNISDANRWELDPVLTNTGQEQARALTTLFPYQQDRPIRIFSSPLRRAIQTALIGFSNLLPANTGRVICLAEAQEVGSDPCDTGISLGELSTFLTERKVDNYVDLSHVPEGWDSKGGEWSEEAEVVTSRARKLLRHLAEEAAKGSDVVLVTHGYLIHFLIEDWDDFVVMGHGCGFRNCEFRSYDIVKTRDGEVKLIETERSKALRNAPPPAATVQRNACN